jgi:hypothetical protein
MSGLWYETRVLSARDERLANNESAFREVNERLKELGESFSVVAEQAEFICECGDPTCVERISLSLDEYERVRSEPTHFVVVPRHVDREIEVVIREDERHAVVEKRDPDAVEIAEQLDPRSEQP